MEIGSVFTLDGEQFAIRKITPNRVDASRMVADKNGVKKPSKGRPRAFSYATVVNALKNIEEETEETSESNEPEVQETIPEPSEPEIDTEDSEIETEDFLAEVIEEETARTPSFPSMVEKALERRSSDSNQVSNIQSVLDVLDTSDDRPW